MKLQSLDRGFFYLPLFFTYKCHQDLPESLIYQSNTQNRIKTEDIDCTLVGISGEGSVGIRYHARVPDVKASFHQARQGWRDRQSE
jgi:hypothetical protein